MNSKKGKNGVQVLRRRKPHLDPMLLKAKKINKGHKKTQPKRQAVSKVAANSKPVASSKQPAVVLSLLRDPLRYIDFNPRPQTRPGAKPKLKARPKKSSSLLRRVQLSKRLDGLRGLLPKVFPALTYMILIILAMYGLNSLTSELAEYKRYLLIATFLILLWSKND